MRAPEEMTVDYLMSRLSAEEEQRYLNAVENKPELKIELEEIRRLLAVTKRLGQKEFKPEMQLEKKVMSKIKNEVPKKRKKWSRRIVEGGAAAGLVMTVLIVTVTFLGRSASYSFSSIGSSISGNYSVNYSWPVNQAVPSKAHLPAQSELTEPLESFGRYRSDELYRDRGNSFDISRRQSTAGEQYRAYVENKRVLASKEPISTFSIDVDSGSYTNSRRIIKDGSIPPPDAVRVEEFINYFDYSYGTPEDDKPFALRTELAPSPFARGRFLLKLGISTKPVRRSDSGWNLVFLVDTSGSMQDRDKLPLVKQGMRTLVENMSSTDRLAIVTYAGDSRILLDSTSGANRRAILAAIDTLQAGGSTNGAGGISAAYNVAERNFVRAGVNRIILATDGDFNVGITSFEDLVRLVEEKRRGGVTLTSIGVGTGNYNEQNLEQLSNKGNGNYFYLDSEREASRVLGEKLTSNVEVVAKDVKLQIEFNPAAVSTYRLIGYANRRLRTEDFSNDAIDAGEIGAGHTVTALYEVAFSDSAESNELKSELRYATPVPASAQVAEITTHSDELGLLRIRYKEPEGAQSKLLEFPLSRTPTANEIGQASNDFRFSAAVAAFGDLLSQSEYASEISLNVIREVAEGSISEDAKGQRKEFLQLVDTVGRLKSLP